MNNKYKIGFVFTILILLYLPLTYFLGVKDNTVIYGVEAITELPSIQEQSLTKRNFQTSFESWWNGHFALRFSMLKLKNQIYDWANLGQIHSGFASKIIEGKNGYLFEKEYFDSFARECKKIPNDIRKIKKLNYILRKNGINLFIILAPNKVVTYPDFIPNRYKFFLGEYCNYYNQIETQLQNDGVKVFNAQNLITFIREKEDYPPFSITGTHWTHYAAGRTLQEVAKKFNWGKIKITKIETSTTPYTTETDLSRLLNLIVKYKPKQQFYKPVLKPKTSLDGDTTIIGNSFSNEFTLNLKDSHLINGEINQFENPPLNNENMKQILQSKRIILVYTDSAIMDEQNQFYKKINFLLSNIKQ